MPSNTYWSRHAHSLWQPVAAARGSALSLYGPDREEHIWFSEFSQDPGFSDRRCSIGLLVQCGSWFFDQPWFVVGRRPVRGAWLHRGRGARLHSFLAERFYLAVLRQCVARRFWLRFRFGVRANARAESAMLEGPYNIRLHLTAPRGYLVDSVRGEWLWASTLRRSGFSSAHYDKSVRLFPGFGSGR
jgi:hypothetical protein